MGSAVDAGGCGYESAVMTARKCIVTVGAAVAALAVIVYLAMFDPTVYPAPQCLFHRLTGLDCPGCGTQRAVHAMFAGDFGRAWSSNPALFFALAYVGLYALPLPRLKAALTSGPAIYAVGAAILFWWVFRNIAC